MTATDFAPASAPAHPTHPARTKDTAYTRRLSGIERGYLNAAATGTPQLIQMVIEGDGHLDPRALTEAIALATQANPGLAVRRRAGAWRGGGPLPPLTDLADVGVDAPFYLRDLDVVNGPVCEVGVHQEAGTARLVVRASHIATDGRGLRNWIEDVFRVLRGQDPVGAAAVVDDTHFRAAAGTFAPAPPPVRVAPFPAVLGHGPAEAVPLWTRRRVRACPTGVTARVAAGISKHLATDTGRIIVPVDLRRHDRSVRSTANLTAQLVLDIRRADSWRRLHGQILNALARKHEVAQLDRDFLRSNPFANSLREAQELDGDRFPCTAIITDHGRVDTEPYRTAHFQPTGFATLPMLVPYAELFLSACQIGEETELTVSCRRRAGAQAACEALLDDIERKLTETD
ncbi:MAG TPA: hypothetical protein VGX23_12125 [Actinocrinis sp.]|nr:hypothetical protein [Actinocrinis sp.]